MEVMFAWFWLINMVLVFILVFVLYKTVKWNFKSKVWNISSVVVMILIMISPVKLIPSTDRVNKIQNVQIEQSKVLPEMVKDESFKKNTEINGITKADLK